MFQEIQGKKLFYFQPLLSQPLHLMVCQYLNWLGFFFHKRKQSYGNFSGKKKIKKNRNKRLLRISARHIKSSLFCIVLHFASVRHTTENVSGHWWIVLWVRFILKNYFLPKEPNSTWSILFYYVSDRHLLLGVWKVQISNQTSEERRSEVPIG